MKISAIFSSVAAEKKMPYNISNYLKLWYYVEYGLIFLRTKFKKKFIEWFLILAQFKNVRAIFDKKQNDSLHQLIFKLLFLKVNWRDFSETHSR